MDSTHDFLEVCARDDVATVRLLIDQGVAVDAADNDDVTGLQMAAANGSVCVARELIARGASLEKHNTYGWTPLLHAARHGHKALVALLLQNHADIHVCTDLGVNALTLAAHWGHQAVCRLLLDAGMDPVGADMVGVSRSACEFTPLMLAAHRGQDAVVKCLLDGMWGSGLGCASSLRKFCDIQPGVITERLKQNSTNSVTVNNSTDNSKCTNNEGGVVNAGFDSNKSLDNIVENEQTSKPNFVKSLPTSNVNTSRTSGSVQIDRSKVEFSTGWTRDGYVDRESIKQGKTVSLDLGLTSDLWSDDGNWIGSATDINHRTPSLGVNALMLAALAGHMTTAQMLVERGANANLTNVNGHTALDIAQLSGQREVQGYLERKTTYRDKAVARDARPDIIEATRQGDIERVSNILERDPSQRDVYSSIDGATPLMYAGIARRLDLARLLVEAGCDVNKQDNINGWTALMQAIVHGSKAVALYLISVGADVTITAKNGCTAFDMVTFIEDIDTDLYRLLAARSVQAPAISRNSAPTTAADKSLGTVPTTEMNGQLNGGTCQSDDESSHTNLKAWWNRMSNKFRNMKLGRTFNLNRLGPLPTLNEKNGSGNTMRDDELRLEEEDAEDVEMSKYANNERRNSATATAAANTHVTPATGANAVAKTSASHMPTAAFSVDNVTGLGTFTGNSDLRNSSILHNDPGSVSNIPGMQTLGGQTLIGTSTMSRSLLQLPTSSPPPFMPPPSLPVDRSRRMPPLVVNPRSCGSSNSRAPAAVSTSSTDTSHSLALGHSMIGQSGSKLLLQTGSVFNHTSVNHPLAPPTGLQFSPPFSPSSDRLALSLTHDYKKNHSDKPGRSGDGYTSRTTRSHRGRAHDDDVTSHRKRVVIREENSPSRKESSHGGARHTVGASATARSSGASRSPGTVQRSSSEVSPSASSESSVLSSVISSGTSQSRLTSSSSTLTATSQHSGSGGGSGRRSGGSRSGGKPSRRSPRSKDSASTLTPSPSPQPGKSTTGKSKDSKLLQTGEKKGGIKDDEYDDDDDDDDDGLMTDDKTANDRGLSKDDDMAVVLQKLSLEKYRPIFEEQEVDMEAFLTLTDGDLCELGVSHAESRREIVQAIQELNAGKDRERLHQHHLLLQYSSTTPTSRSTLLPPPTSSSPAPVPDDSNGAISEDFQEV